MDNLIIYYEADYRGINMWGGFSMSTKFVTDANPESQCMKDLALEYILSIENDIAKEDIEVVKARCIWVDRG